MKKERIGTAIGVIGIVAILLKATAVITIPWAIVLLPHIIIVMESLANNLFPTDRNKTSSKESMLRLRLNYYGYFSLITLKVLGLSVLTWNTILMPFYILAGFLFMFALLAATTPK